MDEHTGYYFLTVEGERLVVKYGPKDNEVTRPIRDAQDYGDFFTAQAETLGVDILELTIMASSTVDFPAEYTDREDVILLCNLLRRS